MENTLFDELYWASYWLIELETPPCPHPSAWTDTAWCEHWRSKRKRVVDAIVKAMMRETARELKGHNL